MTTPSKAALRAELEAALASYRGPVKQCPAAAPPELVVEEELELFDDEDEAEEDILLGYPARTALADTSGARLHFSGAAFVACFWIGPIGPSG